MIYLDDNRDYSRIVEGWVRDFIETMDEDEICPGNDSGQAPAGVKIIFDGYGLDEEDNEDQDHMSFAVFVHKSSLTDDFPPHEQTPWALIHRPKEEVCIYCWYTVSKNDVDIIPFEENHATDLDHKFVQDLIFQIFDRDNK